jgi:hypothetical protein
MNNKQWINKDCIAKFVECTDHKNLIIVLIVVNVLKDMIIIVDFLVSVLGGEIY